MTESGMSIDKDRLTQDAQTTVDALRLAVASRAIAPDERVWWVIEQILAFAPRSDGSDTAGARAFHEAIKDYWGTNRQVTIDGFPRGGVGDSESRSGLVLAYLRGVRERLGRTP